MVFGAEADERFDWTRFEVTLAPQPQPQAKAECKDGGWKDFSFASQGKCILFVQDGIDTR